MSVNLHEVTGLQFLEVNEEIVARPLEDDDADQLLAVIESDDAIRERVKFARDVHSIEDVYVQVSEYKADPDTMRYVLAMGQRVVGLVSFWRLGNYKGMNEPDTYGFGYFLDSSARGKGIIPLALRSIMTEATRTMPVQRFIAWCEDDNVSSIAVLKKSGFTPTNQVDYFPEYDWRERLFELRHQR